MQYSMASSSVSQQITTTEATPQPARPGKTILLKRRVAVEKLTALSEKYDREVVCRPGSVHHHPTLAVERELAQEMALGYLSRKVLGPNGVLLDVFGNERSLARSGVRHHSVMPYHHQSDLVRWSEADRECACQHEPELCDCVVGSAAYFMQSVQYLTPERLAGVIARTTSRVAVSVLHRFEGLAGSFYKDEQTWYRSGPREVTCRMDKGTTVWKHDSLDWLGSDYYVSSVDACVSSLCLGTFGVTEVWLHTLTDPARAVPLVRYEWNPSSFSSEGGLYALPNSFTGALDQAYHLTRYKFKSHSIRVFRSVILFVGSTEDDVVLSTPIVSGLATYLCGKELNAATFRLLVTKCKSDYTMVPNLPADRLPKCVLLSCLLAMSQSATLMTPLMTEFLYNHSELMLAHNEAVAFKARPSYDVNMLGGFAVSTAISTAVAVEFPTTLTFGSAGTASNLLVPSVGHVVVPTVCHVTMAMGGAVLVVPAAACLWAAVSTLCTCKWLYDKYGGSLHTQSVVRTWEGTVPGAVPATRFGVTKFALGPIMFAATQNYLASQDVGRGNKVSVYPEQPKNPKPILSHKSIAFQIVPTYYDTTLSSLHSALTNRLVLTVPLAERGAWSSAVSIYKTMPNQVEYSRNSRPVVVNVDTVRHWAERSYPTKRVAEFVDAFLRFEASGFKLTKQVTNFKAFVKVEKQVALTVVDDLPEQHETKAPRLILAASDEMLSVMGPVCSEVARRKAAVFQRLSADSLPGIAPRGVSVETFGEWHDAAFQVLGGDRDQVLVLVVDGKKWDAHMRTDALKAQTCVLFSPMRFENPVIKGLMNQREVRGGSRLGLSFNAGHVRATGEGPTDVGNTELNQIQAVAILETGTGGIPDSGRGLGSKYFIAAAGDDLYVMVRRGYLYAKFKSSDHAVIAQAWHAGALRLGIEATLNLVPYGEGDFCSKWTYPVGGRTLLGGKIGRVLSRAGFFLNLDSEETVYSAAMGQLQDNYHVPFLREYFETVVRLATKTAVTPSKERRHQFHSGMRHDYQDDTMDFVHAKYGLSREDLADFCGLLAQVQALPVTITWDRLPSCLRVDSA